MINDIQNFENAARIATADALFFEGEGKRRASAFRRWFSALSTAFSTGMYGLAAARRN